MANYGPSSESSSQAGFADQVRKQQGGGGASGGLGRVSRKRSIEPLLLSDSPPATTPLATDQLPILGDGGFPRRESPCLAIRARGGFRPIYRGLSRSDGETE